MSTTAILFSVKGSETTEMRDLVADVRPDLLEQVAEIVGEDPFAKANEGTNYAQPAIFCASLAGWESLGRPDGDFMAGHSLVSSPRSSPRARSRSTTASSSCRFAGA